MMISPEPFFVEFERARKVCRLVQAEAEKMPGYLFEQFVETSCWISQHDWFVMFSWGHYPEDPCARLVCHLLRKDFRDAYLRSVDLEHRASLLWSSPSCLSITGHLLDEIDVDRTENFSERIAFLLQVLERKGATGLRKAWEEARSFESRYWSRYLTISWIETP